MDVKAFVTQLLAESDKKDEEFPIRQLGDRCRGSDYTLSFSEPIRGNNNKFHMKIYLTKKAPKDVKKDVQDGEMQKDEPRVIFDPHSPGYPSHQKAKQGVAAYALKCLRDGYATDLSTLTDENRVDGEFPVKLLRVFNANFHNWIEKRVTQYQTGEASASTPKTTDPAPGEANEVKDDLSDLSDTNSADFDDFDSTKMVIVQRDPLPEPSQDE